MAKGRLISTEISLDYELNAMSTEALLCYILAFTNLDRDGLIDAHPSKLWAMIGPLRVELLDRMPHLIDEWIRTNKVIRYPIGGGQHVLFFKDFRKYNLRMKYHNEAESSFPPPPNWERSKAGLIPTDLETRERMAMQFDRRSQYREALEAHLKGNLSRQKGDRVASESRESRDQRQDQDHIEDQSNYGGGGDQIIHTTTLVSVDQGGVGGDSLSSFDRHTLITAAYQLGSLLGFHTDWNDYADYLERSNIEQLCLLLRWIKRHLVDDSLRSGVKSLPATIIANIRKGTRAHLNGKQEQELVREIMLFVEADVWQEREEAHETKFDF